MVELGPATQDEMILAFLRAEIRSSRYRQLIMQNLARVGFEERLIDSPNLADARENNARERLLCYRGWPNTFLFQGFPRDATWRRVLLEPRDFEAMRYIDDADTGRHWVNLSDGTRLVTVGARNVRQRPTNHDAQQIVAIAERVRTGSRFPELITVQADDASLILLEGHSRATAYVIEQLFDRVEALVASSTSMPAWYFYARPT
jgi:hypothetical protein